METTVSDFYSEIRRINFPERLDKIDNQISAINIGIGNLQTAIQQIQGKIESSFETTNTNIRRGFQTTNELTETIGEKITSNLVSHINSKILEQNAVLKKGFKVNKIIGIVIAATILIAISLILILVTNQP